MSDAADFGPGNDIQAQHDGVGSVGVIPGPLVQKFACYIVEVDHDDRAAQYVEINHRSCKIA